MVDADGSDKDENGGLNFFDKAFVNIWIENVFLLDWEWWRAADKERNWTEGSPVSTHADFGLTLILSASHFDNFLILSDVKDDDSVRSWQTSKMQKLFVGSSLTKEDRRDASE